MAILLAFIASLGWGTSDFLGGLASKNDRFLVVAFVRGIFEVAAFSVLVIFVSGVFRWSDIGLGLGVGVFIGLALPLFFYALANGRMAVVAPITGLVGAIVPIAAGVIGGERPSFVHQLGLALAVAAVVLISVQHVDDGSGGQRRHFEMKDILVAVVCGLAFGCYFVGLHHTSEDSGFWPLVAVCVGLVLAQFMLLAWRSTSQPWVISGKGFVLCVFGAGFEIIAGVSYLIATRHGLLSITAGVASLYPVYTAFLAYVFLREQLSRYNVAGLLACGTALALIAF